MNKFNLWVVIGFFLLAGCSTKQVQESDADTKYDCMSEVIGTSTLKEWGAAFPVNTIAVSCDGELVEVANNLAENNIAVSVIEEWYGTLPSDLSAKTMSSWVLSGLPISVASEWYGLGLNASDTKRLYDYGNTIEQTREMLTLGVSVEAIGDWVASGIPFRFWKTWIDSSVSADNAKRLTELHGISTNDEIKEWLADFMFEPLTNAKVRAGTWICSRNNSVAILESITGNKVELVNRYALVANNGLPIKSMVIFDKSEFNSGGYRLVKSIFRASSLANEWAECPAYVKAE